MGRLDAHTLRRIHTWAGWGWLVLGVPAAWAITYVLPESRHAAFAILVISLWANAISHWGTAGAARAEEAASGNDPTTD